MPLLSLAEVAKRTGMARSSIYRLIDEGKISATLDPRGRKCIELTELLRVFGTVQNETEEEEDNKYRSNNSIRTSRIPTETGQDNFSALIQEVEKLRSELRIQSKDIEIKDRELTLMRDRVNDLKATNEQAISEKNRFLEIIERQSLLLAAPKPATTRQRAPAKKKEVLSSNSTSSKVASASKTSTAKTKKPTAPKSSTTATKSQPAKKRPAIAKKPLQASAKKVSNRRK